MLKHLLSATLLAAAVSITAQITFEDITPDEMVNATYAGDSFVIDFDNDLSPEIEVFGLKKDTSVSGFPMTITGVVFNTIGATEVAGTSASIGGETILVATLFNSGDVIDGSLAYVNSNTPSIFPGVGLGAIGFFLGGSQTRGDFPDQGFKYAGCKFNSGTTDMFGWVRLKQNLGTDTVIVDSYGFEAIGSSIIAGDTGSGTVSVEESDINKVQLTMTNGNLALTGLKDANVAIYTLIGKQIFNKKMNGTLNWNMNAQVAGIYLVTYSMNGKMITEKVIVQ